MQDDQTAPTVGSDILFGVEPIAAFLDQTPRKAQYLITTKQIPTFRLGRQVCASRRALRAHFEELQREASMPIGQATEAIAAKEDYK